MLVFHLYLAPDGPPVNINITMVTPYSVSLQWDPPTPDKRNGLIVSYTINVMTYDQVVKMVVLSNTTQQTISNLTPYTPYMFKLAASTTIGQGPLSKPILTRTSETSNFNTFPVQNLTCLYFHFQYISHPVPTSPPVNLSLVTSISTSVTLSWAPPPTQDQNGIITGYTLQVFSSQLGLLRETNVSSNGSTVDSLHPYTTYLFRVAAMTVVGRGPYSDYLTVTTQQDGRCGGLKASYVLLTITLHLQLPAVLQLISTSPSHLDLFIFFGVLHHCHV